MPRTITELLNLFDLNTHVLWKPSIVDEVNEAFGINLRPHNYVADGHVNPKGLTTADGKDIALGLACFDLVPMICEALNVPYESKMGRGFQVRACTDALRAHLPNSN